MAGMWGKWDAYLSHLEIGFYYEPVINKLINICVHILPGYLIIDRNKPKQPQVSNLIFTINYLDFQGVTEATPSPFHGGNTGLHHEVPDGTRMGAIHPVGAIQYNELKGKGLQRCNPFFIA